MADNLLVVEPLTDGMISAGKDLLARLRGAPLNIVAAFWLFTSEAGEWRCTLASPQIDVDGPKKVYEAVWMAMYGEGDISLFRMLDFQRIVVVRPEERLVRALASADKLVDLSNRFMSNARFDSVFVEGLYVYFVSPSVKPLPNNRPAHK